MKPSEVRVAIQDAFDRCWINADDDEWTIEVSTQFTRAYPGIDVGLLCDAYEDELFSSPAGAERIDRVIDTYLDACFVSLRETE